MKLYDELSKYKELTISMINKVGNNEEFEELIEERQKIIENLKKLKFTKNEIKQYVDELDIIQSDKKLNNLILKEKKKIHEEMVDIKKRKMAQNQYNSFKNYTMGFDFRK